MKRFVLRAGKDIENQFPEDMIVQDLDKIDFQIEPNQVYQMNIVLTTGDGKVNILDQWDGWSTTRMTYNTSIDQGCWRKAPRLPTWCPQVIPAQDEGCSCCLCRNQWQVYCVPILCTVSYIYNPPPQLDVDWSILLVPWQLNKHASVWARLFNMNWLRLMFPCDHHGHPISWPNSRQLSLLHQRVLSAPLHLQLFLLFILNIASLPKRLQLRFSAHHPSSRWPLQSKCLRSKLSLATAV